MRRLASILALALPLCVATTAHAAEPDVAARAALLDQRRQAFAARDADGSRERQCQKPADATERRRCYTLFMAWGADAMAIERGDLAYPYFYDAMSIARDEPSLVGGTGQAWADWSVASYRSSEASDARLAQQIRSVADTALARGYTTGDPMLRLFERLVLGRMEPDRLEFGYPREKVDFAPLLQKLASRPELAQDAAAYNARLLAARRRQAEALDLIETVDRWCGPRDYDADTCLSASISGAMIAVAAGDRARAQRWSERLERALDHSRRSDRMIVLAWGAIGASAYLRGDVATATRHLDAAIRFAELLGQQIPEQIDDTIATYAVLLAETGYYDRALAMANRITGEEARKSARLYYARALAYYRLGQPARALAEYADEECDTVWALKSCLLNMRIRLAEVAALRTTTGENLFAYVQTLKTFDDFLNIPITRPTRIAFEEAMQHLNTYWRSANAARSTFDPPPDLEIERLYLSAQVAIAGGRRDEAITLAQRALDLARGKGLEGDSVSIETRELLARLRGAQGCASAAYMLARRAMGLAMERQARYRDFDAGARNDITRFAGTFRTFTTLAYRFAHPETGIGVPPRCD
ncbi:hypothetical protein [Sphingomonas sp.]|uniref:hypothetical protein n=1 Tax=Sphingomonas sp. TaxID=28214 RepID=UPI001EC256B2|nr:hypothetical protein [Sphingomonas sp.]MBX3594046.1 hypothetical protein [Sphingomonas sp.]